MSEKPQKIVPPELVRANEEWNRFVALHGPADWGGDDWLPRFNDKYDEIKNDELITEEVRRERFADLIAANPEYLEFKEIRRKLMAPLAKYKEQVDRYNALVKPIPYWPLLIDDSLPGSPYHEGNKNNRTIFSGQGYRGDKKPFPN